MGSGEHWGCQVSIGGVRCALGCQVSIGVSGGVR